MNGKKVTACCTLILTICFLVLGIVFKKTAENHRGVSTSFGVMIDGEYSENSSGTIGGNQEKYEMFNTGGTIFYVLAGVMGVICVVSALKSKSN